MGAYEEWSRRARPMHFATHAALEKRAFTAGEAAGRKWATAEIKRLTAELGHLQIYSEIVAEHCPEALFNKIQATFTAVVEDLGNGTKGAK